MSLDIELPSLQSSNIHVLRQPSDLQSLIPESYRRKLLGEATPEDEEILTAAAITRSSDILSTLFAPINTISACIEERFGQKNHHPLSQAGIRNRLLSLDPDQLRSDIAALQKEFDDLHEKIEKLKRKRSTNPEPEFSPTSKEFLVRKQKELEDWNEYPRLHPEEHLEQYPNLSKLLHYTPTPAKPPFLHPSPFIQKAVELRSTMPLQTDVFEQQTEISTPSRPSSIDDSRSISPIDRSSPLPLVHEGDVSPSATTNTLSHSPIPSQSPPQTAPKNNVQDVIELSSDEDDDEDSDSSILEDSEIDLVEDSKLRDSELELNTPPILSSQSDDENGSGDESVGDSWTNHTLINPPLFTVHENPTEDFDDDVEEDEEEEGEEELEEQPFLMDPTARIQLASMDTVQSGEGEMETPEDQEGSSQEEEDSLSSSQE